MHQLDLGLAPLGAPTLPGVHDTMEDQLHEEWLGDPPAQAHEDQDARDEGHEGDQKSIAQSDAQDESPESHESPEGHAGHEVTARTCASTNVYLPNLCVCAKYALLLGWGGAAMTATLASHMYMLFVPLVFPESLFCSQCIWVSVFQIAKATLASHICILVFLPPIHFWKLP